MAGVISTAILRTQTDERLVGLARAGHKRAFEAIAERYRPELTRALRRILPPASVEDALQQTHLQAWQALSAGTEVRELRAWLHRIARNAAIAVASRGYDYDELNDALLISPGPHEDLERRDAVRRALRGIAELPDRQRDALLAVAVGGRSHAEVALDLGITDTAARQLVRRARVSLLGLMSVAVPPQVVRWAARAGGSAAAGKATAGKAAAGKAAASTGLGGTIGGSALKVGVIAVAVGGVAAGVPPIRHVLIHPATPAAHARRAEAPAGRVYVAAALRTTSALAARPSSASPAGHAARVERAGVRAADPVVGAVVVTTPTVDPVPPPPPAAAAAAPTMTSSAGGSAASPAAAAGAALAAWWLAHHHGRRPATSATAWPAGRTIGREPGEPTPSSGVSGTAFGKVGGSLGCTPSQAGSAKGATTSDPAASGSAGSASGSGSGSASGSGSGVGSPSASSGTAASTSTTRSSSTQPLAATAPARSSSRSPWAPATASAGSAGSADPAGRVATSGATGSTATGSSRAAGGGASACSTSGAAVVGSSPSGSVQAPAG
jgi:RNA polymerase sigma factor (sigma-70 family)